jgi:hypothetical protein
MAKRVPKILEAVYEAGVFRPTAGCGSLTGAGSASRWSLSPPGPPRRKGAASYGRARSC